jgi:hypothetical protein
MFWVPVNILIDKQVVTVIYYMAQSPFPTKLVTYTPPTKFDHSGLKI